MRRSLVVLACAGIGGGLLAQSSVVGAVAPSKPIFLVSSSSVSLPGPDAAIKVRLESTGRTVTVLDDDTVSAASVAGGDLVVISSSVVVSKVGAKLADVDVPLLSWEALLHDDNKLATNVGETATTTRKIKVTAAGSTVLGVAGEPTVYSSLAKLSFGTVPASAVKLANVVGTPHRAVVFWYDDGALRTDGSAAPQCRAGFFPDYFGAGKLNATGGAIFDALVADLLACAVPPDSDSDGLVDSLEAANGCVVGDADTDDDTLTDGAEVNTHSTKCNDDDTDDDGMVDAQELDKGCNPNDTDTDDDGVEDFRELDVFGSDCNDSDSDDDGLSDGAEANTYGTDPTESDTDGGGLSDGAEASAGKDPLNPADDFSCPQLAEERC